jgi:hypothetical protein
MKKPSHGAWVFQFRLRDVSVMAKKEDACSVQSTIKMGSCHEKRG